MQLARTSKQIGNEIRRQRKRLKLTQSALGEKVGLRQATISEIEAGSSSVKLDTILRTLGALNLEFRITDRSGDAMSDIEDLL